MLNYFSKMLNDGGEARVNCATEETRKTTKELKQQNSPSTTAAKSTTSTSEQCNAISLCVLLGARRTKKRRFSFCIPLDKNLDMESALLDH